MEKKQSVTGILALIFGIVGMLLSCIAIGIIPSVIALVLAIITLVRRDSKHGLAIGGLVCAVVGIGLFLLFSFVVSIFDDNESEVSSQPKSVYVESSESNGGSKETVDLASQMEVTEYSIEDSIGDTLYFLVIKNNSAETVEISINATALNADGQKIGAANSSESALASGYELCLCNFFDGVEDAADFNYTMTVKKDAYYQPVVQDLSVEESKTDRKVVLTCTNNGSKPAQFVEAYGLFFTNGELTDYDSVYITDDDSEIKPGASISKELNCYNGYDDVKVYISGRR